MAKDEKDKEEQAKKRPWWRKLIKIVARVVLFLLLFIFLLIIFIRSPWGQNIITDYAVDYVHKKTNTEVQLKKLFITFGGDISIEGLYLEDKAGDTLIYSRSLEADIPLLPIIQSNKIPIDGVKWSGLRANVHREDTVQGFNYQFLIDAFSSNKPKPKPQKKSKPMDISIGSIQFNDFRITYKDQVSGIETKLNLGSLNLDNENFDLQNMDFHLEELALRDIDLDFTQNYPQSQSNSGQQQQQKSDTASSGKAPTLQLDNLDFKNVKVRYEAKPSNMLADVKIGDLTLDLQKLDLGQQRAVVNQFAFKNSDVYYETRPSTASKQQKQASEKQATTHQADTLPWPEWDVEVKEIDIQNNHLAYHSGVKSKPKGQFDPSHIVLSDFKFKTEKLWLKPNTTAALNIDDISFYEQSGFRLKKFVLDADLNQNSIAIHRFEVQTNRSRLSAEIATEFESLKNLIDHPENHDINLTIDPFQLNVADAYYFSPDLKKQPLMKRLSAHDIQGNVGAKGKLEKLDLQKFNLEWGEGFNVSASGNFTHLLEMRKLTYKVPKLRVNAARKTLMKFLPDSLGLQLPKTMRLNSSLSGTTKRIKTQTNLTTSLGNLNLDAQVNNENRLEFDLALNTDKVDLGTIMKMKELEPLSMTLNTSGSGKNLNELDAQLKADFQQLVYKSYDFSPLKLSGTMNNGQGDIKARFKDKNLNLKLNSSVALDSSLASASVKLNVIGADLFALGVTKKKIRTQFSLNADYKKQSNGFTVYTRLDSVTAVYDKRSYNLDALTINAAVEKDSTNVDISGGLINGTLKSNAKPGKIASAIGRHLKHYFPDTGGNKKPSKTADSLSKKPVNLQFEAKIVDAPIISEVFVDQLNKLDTITAKVNFEEKAELLTSEISIPKIDYGGNKVDSLKFTLHAGHEDADLNFAFSSLQAGPVNMERTEVEGILKEGVLNAGLTSFKGGKKFYNIQSVIKTQDSSLVVHFKQDSLLLNNNQWSIPQNNSLTIDKSGIHAQDMTLTNQGSELALIDQFKSGGDMNINFKDFKLENLTALLNPEEKLLGGSVNGKLKMKPGKSNSKVEADLTISGFQAFEVPLGEFTVKTKNAGEGVYNIDAGIQGDSINLKINGDLTSAGSKTSKLNLDVNLKELAMSKIARFSNNAIANASGSLAAKVKTSGTLDSLQYDGYLQFDNASAEVVMLNNQFTISNDKIMISNKQVQFKQLKIKDENGNPFKVDGKILTESMTNPEFDLSLKANDFMAMNSTKKDNDLYYGTAVFDIDASIGGTLNFPKIDMEFTVDKKTDVTYVLPQSRASMQEREGVVEFVNKHNPEAILTRKTKEKTPEALKGMELNSRIKIKKGSIFRVVTNPKTNDNLELKGFGDLMYSIARNGDTRLTGQYEILDGHYELSLYNLVNRRFDIAKGSKVTWSGDPMDGNLDVRAIYEVKTSVSPLMASQVSGESSNFQDQYDRRLPILVYLNVDGELTSPRLNFALDMPEGSQGAIGGSVYGRIQQLNNQQDQLNKQVFSLLVLNKFYPEPGSDGSQGGAATIARENLAKAVSDQLNMLGSKITGDTGIDLNFGVNSYNNAGGRGGSQQRTRLNVTAQKKFLNERLIVDVGGSTNVEGNTRPGESATTLGNVQVEYLLTKDGRWRLRGFRQGEYENIIDGQVFVSGIALIFTREFNKFSQLFDGPPPQEQDDKQDNPDKDDKSTEPQEQSTKKDKTKKTDDSENSSDKKTE